MKLIIKSKQIYSKENIQEYTEEFECEALKGEENLEIHFDNGFIEIKENSITYVRGENKILIEQDKVTECDYETKYGMFVLDIKGKEVNTNISINIPPENKESVAKACYEISIVGIEPYINEIEVIIE